MGRRKSKQESEFHNRTGDWATDLLVAIVREAIKDAKRGRGDAINWLDSSLDGLHDDRHIPSKRQCRRR